MSRKSLSVAAKVTPHLHRAATMAARETPREMHREQANKEVSAMASVRGEADQGREAEHIRRNRDAWNEWAAEFAEGGEKCWAADDPVWGIWSVPETDLGVLPQELDGKDALELGCGTAYVSAWLARRGARCVGIDLSTQQLATARRLQRRHGLEFPLHEGSAEHLPFPDASFDLAISEYGACLWADPYLWVPEAARVLRPGGELIFLTNGTIMMLCSPADVDALPTDRLARDYFGMHRFEWEGDPSIEFHLGYGDWIRLLRTNGFELEDLIEVRPATDATTSFDDMVTLEWSRRWPSEEIWKARKRA
jgi:SAM-dependent methyltransferase